MKSFEYAISSRYLMDSSIGGRYITKINFSPEAIGTRPPALLPKIKLMMQRKGNNPLIL